MTSRLATLAFSCLFLLLAVGWIWAESTSLPPSSSGTALDEAKPVESDMHEFMEYVFQPTFKRLKSVMASQPSDNSAWKAIKSDSLILAEGGNLLLIRQPQDDAADWVEHSEQVRDYGGELYRAAKAKDEATARKKYQSMIESCNACHHQFADGEHILTP